MAKLVDVCSPDKEPVIKRRQMPVIICDNLTMIMDLNSMGLICDNPQVKGRDYEDFMRTYRELTPEEVKQALRVTSSDIVNVLNESIPCVGCRRSVEKLFHQLVKSGHPTIDPLVITPDGIMTIRDDKLNHPQSLATLLHGYDTNLECLVDSQHRWKRARRCPLHSLEATGRGAAWGGGVEGWHVAWENMRTVVRESVATLSYETLSDTLHCYLRKHRFCHECKTKVLRAYQLLTEEAEPQKEKGYVASLYAGMKRCIADKHLHLQCKTDFIADLIARAEPELLGGHRERHAKTLEYAQEEVVICVGVCVYDRMQRVWARAREEESAAQLLAASGVATLHRALALAADRATPRAITILSHEASRQRTRQQKKLRKRKRKERQAGNKNESCDCEECVPSNLQDSECSTKEDCECEDKQECECEGKCEVKPECVCEVKQGCECEAKADDCSCVEQVCACEPVASITEVAEDVNKRQWSCSELSQDCGYGSRGGGSASPISSASSDASCCRITLSLQQMLQECNVSSDEDGAGDTSYIPLEEVMEFKSRKSEVTAERQRLRETLRNRFAAICTQGKRE